jgi:hypothetical protein
MEWLPDAAGYYAQGFRVVANPPHAQLDQLQTYRKS